jgi:hypothetical protein
MTMVAVVEPIGNAADVVTATRRLAQQILDDDTGRQRAAGRRAWPTPEVRYVEDWLLEEWQGLAAPGGRDPPVLLDAAQEQVLWEQVVDGVAPVEFLGDRIALAAALRSPRATRWSCSCAPPARSRNA